MEDSLLHRLALIYIPNIGNVQAKQLVAHCGSAENVFKAGTKVLNRIPGIGPRRVSDILNGKALVQAEKELNRIKGKDIRILYYQDKNYPSRLKHYQDCPVILFQKGDIDLNGERFVSVIGTRQPSDYGEKMCNNLIKDLSALECVIISGLAYGIDSIAHRVALRENMETIGVLGSGLDWIYPSTNMKIAQKMTSQGGLLSEFPLGTKPDRENFPMRNRIIAGLSDVLIVIESGRKGGSMITAEYANNYNKDVFAVPGRTTDPLSAGCNHLIKAHKAYLCGSAADISYIMRWDKRSKSQQMELHLDLTVEEKKIYKLICENKEIALDSLIYSSAFSLSSLNSILLNLEFKGLVKSKPGKKYILN